MITLLLLLLLADWVTVSKDVDAKVVRLDIQNDNHATVCTGSVINTLRGLLLTAAHCVPSKGDYEIVVNSKPAKVIKIHKDLDIAVLSFTVRGEREITLAHLTPPEGTEIAVVGYGMSEDKIAKQYGRVSRSSGNRMWIDVMTLFGDSGGPVIDGYGRLVAVTSQLSYDGPTHIGTTAHIEDVREFVKDYLPSER